LGSLLALFREQFRIVAGEFFERDEEVSEDELESLDIGGVDEETLDEVGNLSAKIMLVAIVYKAMPWITHDCRFGKAFARRFPTKPLRNSLLDVPGAARSGV